MDAGWPSERGAFGPGRFVGVHGLQRLGLKLEGGKAPYDTVVIDHVVTNLG